MKVLNGTTNPSKANRFKLLLKDYGLEFLTLSDLNITAEPEERGSTPEENAVIKANYYGQFHDPVICTDSGLYFDELPLNDSRQPGLNIRTPKGGPRMNDEESLTYYTDLIHSLGGKVLAYYLDGVAVYRDGKVYSFTVNREDVLDSAFYMVDTPAGTMHPGWPLDSISVNRNTGTYFTEQGDNKYDSTEENIMLGEYRDRLMAFLIHALGLESE